jgi:hypothetical protein
MSCPSPGSSVNFQIFGTILSGPCNGVTRTATGGPLNYQFTPLNSDTCYSHANGDQVTIGFGSNPFNPTTQPNAQLRYNYSNYNFTTFIDPSSTCSLIKIYHNSGGVEDSANYILIFPPTPPPSYGGGVPPFLPPVGSPGDQITIYGTNFTGTSTVTFNGTPGTFTVVSNTQIIATIPNGATPGPVYVTTSAGTTQTPQSLFIIPSLIGPAAFHWS